MGKEILTRLRQALKGHLRAFKSYDTCIDIGEYHINTRTKKASRGALEFDIGEDILKLAKRILKS